MSIEAFAHAIPSICHSAADIAQVTGADEDFIRDKIGLSTRYVLGPDETGTGLSVAACEALFAKHPSLRETVDLLICVTQTPDRRIPHNAAGIVAGLDLPHSVASFDLSLGCSGYVYALTVAEGFLAATGGTNAVVVTCDPYSRIIAPEDRDTNCVFGDAATATWVRAAGASLPGRGEVLALDFGTDGAGGDAIAVPGGGAAWPLLTGLTDADRGRPERDDLRLHMAGRAVFNFVNGTVPKSIHRCLERAEIGVEDVDLFALHQGSIYMLDAMARRVGIAPERVLKNMDRYGNTVSSSIPLLLSEADQNGSLSGKRVLMSGFGVGLSWSTALVRF